MKLNSKSINYNVQTVDELVSLDGLEGDTVVVTDENRGGVFVYREDNVGTNNGGTIFNGWTRQYDGAVNVKWFGDDTTALYNAVQVCKLNSKDLLIDGTVSINSDIDIENINFNLKGINNGTIICLNGSGISLSTNDVISHLKVESLSIIDGNDLTGYQSTPLLDIGKSFAISISNCKILGKSKRTYGLKVGTSSTVWGSRFTNNHFGYCGINVVIGDTGDATHNMFTNNTVDHASICGAIFCNPGGGIIESNSFEWIKGKVGVAILSNYGASGNIASDLKIKNNYILNVATENIDDVDSCGISYGFDVPDTLYTSTSGCRNISVENNFIGAVYSRYAIKAHNFVHSEIKYNSVSSSESTNSIDIYLKGNLGIFLIDANRNTNTGASNRYSLDVVDTPTVRIPQMKTEDLALTTLTASEILLNNSTKDSAKNRNKIIPLQDLSGSQNVTGTIFDSSTQGNLDAYLVLITKASSSLTSKEHYLLLVSFLDSTITILNSSTSKSMVFSIVDGLLKARSPYHDWIGTATLIGVGNPY